MKIPSVSRRIWLIISTVIVMGAFFSYYFLVYMENRKEELQDKKFRTLAQYAENISNAYEEATKRANQDKRRRGIQLSINPIIRQTEFDELVFQIAWYDTLKESKLWKNSKLSRTVVPFRETLYIQKQTFTNQVTDGIIDSILKKDNAAIARQVEFRVNNKDYIIFIHDFQFSHQGGRMRIFGFCDLEKFSKEVRSVDLIYGVAAALILILMLLMMPLLKLWVMNELEKLRTINVWFSGFSLVVGSSFLLVMVLMANDFFFSYDSSDNKHNRNTRIQALSGQIQKRFIQELTSIEKQIQEAKVYDNLIDTTQQTDTDLNITALQGVKLYGFVLRNSQFQFSAYPYFNELLWIKKGGNQSLVLATHFLANDDTVNLSKRRYFSNAYDGDTWLLPNRERSPDSNRFTLQSIHSYLTSQHEAGFGTRRIQADTTVLAMATKLHSVMDPLLPPGYQFAIINRDGKLWFHSNTEKNMSENFFNEVEWDKRFVASIRGRDSVMMDIQYNRNKYRACVTPIRNTELFLVVLHDHDFFNTPIVLTVGLASFLVFLMFLIQGIHQAMLVITTHRFTLLKINRFFLSWLRPQREKLSLYRKGVIVQLILLVPVGVIVTWFHQVYVIVCFLTLPIYLTAFHYFSLERARLKREKLEQHYFFAIHPFLFTSMLLVFFINLSGFYYFPGEKMSIAIALQLLILSVMLIAYRRKPQTRWRAIFLRYRTLLFMDTRGIIHAAWLKWRKRDAQLSTNFRKRSERFESWYYAFLFLWLMLASSAPTYYFYKIGYYEEGHVWMRYLQWMAAQEREARDFGFDSDKKLHENFSAARIDSMKSMGDYQEADGTLTREIQTCYTALSRSAIHELLFKGAPALTGHAEFSRTTVYPEAGDKRWVWFESDKEPSSTLRYTPLRGAAQYYTASFAPYRLFKGEYWPVMFVVNILSVLVLYRTLRFCVTHIFGLGLLSANTQQVPGLPAGARLFVVGLPHSGKSKLVALIKQQRKVRIDDEKVLMVDFSTSAGISIRQDCELIVATNFHMDLNNHECNQRKLETMMLFQKHTDIPVIIVSNLEPITILEFYNKLAAYYHKEKGDYDLEGDYRKCKQAYRKWKNLLSGYSIHYHALKQDRFFKDPFIDYELNHGEYLPTLKQQFTTPILTIRQREEMILHVEELSQLYYQALWNSLSCQEKFLLFDLAKDRFVNMRNMKTIQALRQKGLLLWRNSLHIMNKSFNNFILSTVEEDDEMKMEEEMRKKGSWNTLHLILVIAIISILAFLGLAQQELFKNFQGIIAATTALLPLLARFGGVFSGTKTKD